MNRSNVASDIREGVIQRLNRIRQKKLVLTKAAKSLGASPVFLGAATAGLAIWLASSALNSKKNVQGAD